MENGEKKNERNDIKNEKDRKGEIKERDREETSQKEGKKMK